MDTCVFVTLAVLFLIIGVIVVKLEWEGSDTETLSGSSMFFSRISIDLFFLASY